MKSQEFQGASEYFGYLFPYALRYGMTKEQYWKSSDASEYWAYRKSYLLGIEHERDNMNFQSWLSGLYNSMAINSATGGEKYMSQPFDFEEEARLANMTEEEKLEEEIKKEEQFIMAEAMKIDRILKEQQKNGGGND